MKATVLKLCGNHSLQDLQLSVTSGVPYIGIVFAESKRKVDPALCGGWLKQIEKGEEQKYVGVFVNPTLQEISHVLSHVPLDIIQFHGNESPEEIIEIKLSTGLTVWKAIHHNQNGLKKMKSYNCVVDSYVIDSTVKGAWGGTGTSFDWESIPAYNKEAEAQGVQCLIAGGITPLNIDEILVYSPEGIDISSGIETNGSKDGNKIQVIMERLKKSGHSLYQF